MPILAKPGWVCETLKTDIKSGRKFSLPPSYFFDAFRHEQWTSIKDTDTVQLDHVKGDHKFGTVGAVACDRNGNLAAERLLEE